MTAFGLTPRQRELLAFIRAEIGRTGSAPSFDEMRVRLALRSKSGVHRMVEALQERGHLTRLPNRSRSLRLTDAQAARAEPPRLVPAALTVHLLPGTARALAALAERRSKSPEALVAEAVLLLPGLSAELSR